MSSIGHSDILEVRSVVLQKCAVEISEVRSAVIKKCAVDVFKKCAPTFYFRRTQQ